MFVAPNLDRLAAVDPGANVLKVPCEEFETPRLTLSQAFAGESASAPTSRTRLDTEARAERPEGSVSEEHAGERSRQITDERLTLPCGVCGWV
jgi:hypothetical protein